MRKFPDFIPYQIISITKKAFIRRVAMVMIWPKVNFRVLFVY